ncbi:hypothetical protein B841_09050 [Corynebacterium maris DSM 45190]|uniref:Uncharacterized protein n=1 Tax=Corynebacterium maris DSM 45190 TaxID=1224163 RepID=S5TKQ4_9CORY|nr:hypothetical protein [Corynebacterium maris]AGS35283.1 hypothetical protein B841_09050 [Corynebacterium maris DSM 45190]
MSSPSSALPVSATHAPRDGAPAPARSSRRRNLAGRVVTVAAAVAVAVGAVSLGAWESTREHAVVDARDPGAVNAEPPPPPPPADPAPVLARLNPQFITGAEVAQSPTGLTVTGTVPEATVATESSTRALAAHLNTLTRDACADSVSVTTAENLRIDLWGFCFSAVPDEELADLLVYAVESEATHIAVAESPSPNFQRHATLTWMPASSVSYDRALDSWEELTKPESLGYIALAAHGTGRMGEYMDSADVTADGLIWGWNSTSPRHPVD